MRRRSALLAFAVLLTWSCGDQAPDDATGESVHSHDGTSHAHPAEEASTAVTLWTDDLELFMEYPVLRVGVSARFAVHLTKLKDFLPVAQGPVLFQFVKTGAAPKMVTVGAPEVPGIFGPTLTFDEVGEYRLHLEILSDEISTKLEHGPIRVLEKGLASAALEERPAGQTISYLKEQQWRIPFATALARRTEIRRTIRIPAEIKAKAGMESRFTAAVSGRYVSPDGGTPGLGQGIRKGDLLGYVELLPSERASLLESKLGVGISLSRLLQDVAQAEAAVSTEQARLSLAEKEARRVVSLVAAEALPSKRLDEISSELEVRKASLSAAQDALANFRDALQRYGATESLLGSIQERLPLYAPISGQLVEIRTVPGQFVDAREMLFRIVDLSSVWVEGQVFENDLAGLDSLRGGTLEVPGQEVLMLEPSSLVLIGSTIDSTARTLPLTFEVQNQDRRLKLGTLGQLELETGGLFETLAVPRSAVLLEENRSVLYVQLEGETFERRPVIVGVRDPQWAEILEGLKEGERVVTLGAYDVALAARSTEIPQHGHVH